MEMDRRPLACWLLLLLLGLSPWLTGCREPSSADDDEKVAGPRRADRKEEKKDEVKEDADFAGEPEPSAAAQGLVAEEDEEPGAGEGGEPKTWKRSTNVANASRLMIGDEESLPIEGMHVHAKVDGFRARVVIDFFFFNPHDAQYEGTFSLRLPDGASPWFLAFGQSAWTAEAGPVTKPRYDEEELVRTQGLEPDLVMRAREASWIEPKQAYMVPREQAAFAYGQTVRRQVDPALLEWSGSGIFDARLFPIEPRKLHRVVVGYDMDLVAVGDDLELQLPIPAGLPSSIVDLDVARPKGVTVTVSPTVEGRGEGRWFRLTDVAGQTVTVRLGKAQDIALTGVDPATGPLFAARLRPTLPAVRTAAGRRRAVFMVDTSMSSNPDRFNVWLALLRSILDENRRAIDSFAVVFFDVETAWYREAFVPNTPENVAALLDHANDLVLEGATDLGAALREASRPAWASGAELAARWDVFLLGDGAATWGEADRYALSGRLREGGAAALFAYRTGMAGGDDAMLQHLARESGGAVFSVVGESEVAVAATAHTQRPWELHGVALEGASDLLVAGRPRVVFPGQTLLVVGRGAPAPGAALVLHLAQGKVTKEVRMELASVIDSALAPRTYGQLAVDQLEGVLELTEPQATAYARHFRVTGASTSLLMLDTKEDYEAYGIVPEADWKTIVAHPAGDAVAKALARFAERLGDPKAAFESQLARLAKTPGVMLEPSAALREALAALPRAAFEVPHAPLHTKSRLRAGIPAEVLEQLAKGTPEYDVLTREAERRRRELGPDDALKALSSLVEAQPGDGVLARDIGFSAMTWGLHAQAYHLFARVARARPFEPQTYRAMATSLAAAGRNELALAYFELGLAGRWDERFGDFREILLQDYLRFLRSEGAKQLDPAVAGYAARRVTELRDELELDEADLLITITWNTDDTDVDLHVTEPSGEECYYGHRTTRSGGLLTADVTEGYGPEMYVLSKAPAGKYQVRAKYFASNENRASARTKVYATITKGWGRADEEVETVVVTLETGKDVHDLATVAMP